MMSEIRNQSKLSIALYFSAATLLLIAAAIFVARWNETSLGAVFYVALIASVICSVAAIVIKHRGEQRSVGKTS